MKYVSIVALLAALAAPSMGYAQDVSVSASGEVSVSVSASVDPSSAISSVSSEVSSAVSSVSSELSSAVSSVSSELSSAVSSASGEVSSELSSSASMSTSSGVEADCDELDISTMTLTAIDAAMLAAVTSVTVFAIDDCSGLGDLAALDGSAVAALGGNQLVVDAMAAAGESGAEVIAYTIDGTSLTVYVRARN